MTISPQYDHRSQSTLFHSFFVRIWQGGAQGAWRASAQCLRTGATVRFADTEALCAFLQEQTADVQEFEEEEGEPLFQI